MSKDYYNILGVNESANESEIKKAYRGLSLKYHPDKNKTVEAIDLYKDINEAYEILGNPQKKTAYDNERNNLNNNFMRMNMNMNMPMPTPNDIFNSFFCMREFAPGNGFGEGGGPQIHIFRNGHPVNIMEQLQKPVPIIKTLRVDMIQVYQGGSFPIEIERWINNNNTKIFEKETIYINLPQGVDDNEIILLENKGNIINNQFKGDIKIIVEINNETEYKRKGLDLIYEKNITLKEALCGFKFQLNFIDNKMYTINNLTGNIIVPEYKKIIPNMGIIREGHQGNLIIIFHIDFPNKLTEEQINKLTEIL